MRVVRGEWVWDVFVALRESPLQYVELLQKIRVNSVGRWPGRRHHYLRDSTLNRTLRRLERMRLVERFQDDEWPFHATYRLSAAARDLLVRVAPMAAWGREHAEVIDAARSTVPRGEA